MLSERDAVKRESSVLMSSAMTDERLAAALLTIEQLTVKLSQEERDHQQQVDTVTQNSFCESGSVVLKTIS